MVSPAAKPRGPKLKKVGVPPQKDPMGSVDIFELKPKFLVGSVSVGVSCPFFSLNLNFWLFESL
jgi:hypothetical protein